MREREEGLQGRTEGDIMKKREGQKPNSLALGACDAWPGAPGLNLSTVPTAKTGESM